MTHKMSEICKTNKNEQRVRLMTQSGSDVTDVRRRTKTNVVATKETTANEFDGWKYKRYFESIWSQSKNIEAGWTL